MELSELPYKFNYHSRQFANIYNRVKLNYFTLRNPTMLSQDLFQSFFTYRFAEMIWLLHTISLFVCTTCK